MNKFTTSISNNVLRVVKHCDVYPCTQIIPLKYITSIEHFTPSRLVIQYNTNNQYNRIELEYATKNVASSVFDEFQKELEKYHQCK